MYEFLGSFIYTTSVFFFFFFFFFFFALYFIILYVIVLFFGLRSYFLTMFSVCSSGKDDAIKPRRRQSSWKWKENILWTLLSSI